MESYGDHPMVAEARAFAESVATTETMPKIIATAMQYAVIHAIVREEETGMTLDSVKREIREMVSRATGVAIEAVLDGVHLFELGVDSLMLAQLDKQMVKRFGVNIPIKRFISDLHTPEKIAAYVLETMPAEIRLARSQAPQPAAEPPEPHADSARASRTAVEDIVLAQMDLMRQQLALLQRSRDADAGVTPVKPSRVLQAASRPVASARAPEPKLKNALRDISLVEEDVNPQQLAFVRDIVARINAKTPRSKAHAQRHRAVFADWIGTLNFSLTTKEMAYPIVSAKSQGARIWDIDGNEYIDTAIGYGVAYFGHNPDFIADAVKSQLAKGVELGPQSDIAGEVAELIHRLTGVERVAFCNTGTEAVMVALRLARAVTKRNKIVRFITSFHGSFDGVLADAGEDGTVPMAPGIPPSMIEDTVVLHYGSRVSLRTIREMGSELAAVLVEPVQSRNPGNYSKEYLQELRRITSESGTALIFDEMITGFRIQTGGAQAYFDVRADLVTYGKIVGGGMPIGVVAGQALYMDAIDGGNWNFGDASGPSRETTFFAGTFCKHPLTMAAARAVLQKIENEGEALLERVNDMTRRFVERVNLFFVAEQAPIQVKRFGSMYRFETKASLDLSRLSLEMNLFFRLLMLDGIYVWERRICFFSVAHTEEDADRIFEAIQRAVAALRQGGFSFLADSPLGGGPKDSVAAPQKHGSADPASAFPLSPEERRIYVLSQMKGGDNAYHVTGALRLSGQCDPLRIRRAFEALARKHPALRTAYVFRDGNVLHAVERNIGIPFEELDPGGRNLDGTIAQFIRPFDLNRAPLWRAALIKRSNKEHVLILDFHHLIADGGSMSILIEDFLAFYRNEAERPASAAYADFVRWEREFAKGPEYSLQREYWMRIMQPLPAPLDLPVDFPRPARNDFAGETVRFQLERAVFRSVRKVAKAHRATPFIVLLAAYLAFMHKLTRQRDFCVGTPLDRRSSGDFDRTIGMFARTLVVRARPEPSMTFAELIEQVRTSCSDAYAHADFPFEELLEQLNMPRDFSRNALFDTMFIFESGNRRLFRSSTLNVETLPVPAKGSAFDLTLEITEEQDVLNCSFIYAKRLFAEATVRRWAGYFVHLLNQVVAATSRSLGDVHIVDADEQALLLRRFNDTARSYPDGVTIASVFQSVAERCTERLALVFDGQTLTYAELHLQAEGIARHLAASGVGRGDLVGIFMPHGVGMVVSMIAVLKTGAAYMPLDTEYPASRIADMLQKSGIRVLLSKPECVEGLSFDGKVLDPDMLEMPGPDATLGMALSSDLAYVIFTSGSSGHPKGVMVEHGSVVNFLHGMTEALVLPEAPVTLGLTTISFDVFALKVFLTFARGGTLVLASEQAWRDPEALIDLIRAHRVSVVQATPSRMQMMLTGRKASDALAGVGTALVGGEAFPPALLEQLKDACGMRIFNVYGPTETTVWSSVKDLSTSDNITLGRPIANTRMYVLDENEGVLPIGCVGDLYIAGSGLARGYFDDEEKNRAVFRPDPFFPGERMYRTGDRAAWTADGELVCHGRADNQIKLRGYRIELAEIESVLQRHDAVENVAVAVRELVPGNPVLAAFCVSASGAGASLSDADLAAMLRSHAALHLPEYMVPAVVMRMESLPFTPDGKIDRLSLPQAVSVPRIEQKAESPADGIEREILAIWIRLVGERPIGMHDSFFDVGGNSFSLVAMHGILSEKYPGALEVADIFANPTISALKKRIEEYLGEMHDDMHDDMPQELHFPANFFDATDPSAAAASLSAYLDGDAYRQFRRTAERFGTDSFELAFLLYLVYLNKLLACDAFELAVAFGKRPEYVLAEVDFSLTNDLAGLVSVVHEQHQSDGWMARRLVPRTTRAKRKDKHGLRSLVAFGADGAANERYGFDIVMRVFPEEEGMRIGVEYDGALLNASKMKSFVANYLKFVKALMQRHAADGEKAGPAF